MTQLRCSLEKSIWRMSRKGPGCSLPKRNCASFCALTRVDGCGAALPRGVGCELAVGKLGLPQVGHLNCSSRAGVRRSVQGWRAPVRWGGGGAEASLLASMWRQQMLRYRVPAAFFPPLALVPCPARRRFPAQACMLSAPRTTHLRRQTRRSQRCRACRLQTRGRGCLPRHSTRPL